MKHFFFLLLILISIITTAQEQITNIVGEGSTTRYILKEYNGEKYIMTTVPFDSLKVYKLVNGTAIFQYGRKFDGIYSMIKYNTTNQFLLFSDAASSIAYNFTNNTLLEIPYEGALENTSWYYNQALDDEIVLRQNTNDFTESKQYLYNLATGQYRLLNSDQYFLKIGNEKLYAYKDLNEVSSQLYIIDKENLSIIDSTNVPLIGRGQDFFDEEDYFVYVNTNEVKRYKFSTKEHELIKTIDQSYQSIRLNKSNEEYVIDVVQFQNHNIIRVHRETLQSSQLFLGDEYANPYPDILYGKYIIPGNQLIVLDTATGQKVNFLSSTRGSGYAILENRYIVYYFVNQHLMLDLATMQQHVLSQMPIKTTVNNTEVMYDNGIYLVNFDNYFGNNQKLYEIDLATKKGTFSNKIINSNEGLPKGSTLIRVKDDVLLVNVENLYHVNGNKATKLNSKVPHLIRNSYYKIDDDVFYWCEFESSKYNIYKVENGQTVNIASLPNLIGPAPSNIIILEDFFVTPNAIFFRGGNPENTQYRYDLQTNQTTEVSNVKNRDYYGIFHNGNYYYTDIAKIVMLKADGTKKDINLNYAHGFENPFIRYKNRLFIKNQEGLLELVDDKLEVRIQNQNEFGIRINVIDGLIILTDHPDDYLYDGIATYKITGSPDQFRGFKILDDYFVIYDGIASNTTIASLLNFKTNTTISLPAEISKLKNIRLFRNAGKYILLGSGGLSPYHKIEIYETDENFSYFSNINEFNVTSRGVISSFTEYINEGFLHTGNAMYLMDTLLNFVPIDGLAGENQTSAVYEQDGYFYFIAIHPINGRQLFRIQPFSLRTSVDDDATIFTKVNVYPNPSSQEIFIEGDVFHSAEIYNFSGHMVQKSTIGDNNRLDINGLNNGVYIVILTSSGGSKSVGKFIKVD
ncbi:MAG TPA: T9SS type A sorting domain-containing protein [Saprospiraceae bacterium]|nr:T9SS type A sorting domain-containing protein [Saprospiraceae bacterium]